MARRKAKRFQGSRCSGNCSGHQAGYAYAGNGGTLYSRYSPSFNNGMRIFLGMRPLTPAKQTGMRITYRKK